MNDQTRNLLIFGALIGAGYLAFSRYAQNDVQSLTLEKTRRITQEIKHQILIVSINFAQGARANKEKILNANVADKLEQLEAYFT